MSEFGFEPGSESESSEGLLHASINGEEYEIGPNDASLFTFIGKRALYDHVFIQLDEEDGGKVTGVYVFSSLRPAVYELMRDHMMDYDYPLHLNLQEVADCDVAAYDSMVDDEMTDLEQINTIPTEWLENPG